MLKYKKYNGVFVTFIMNGIDTTIHVFYRVIYKEPSQDHPTNEGWCPCTHLVIGHSYKEEDFLP